VTAVQQVFPNALIQFEGLGDRTAFRVLNEYRNKARVFNDDMQGTAAVTLAGLYSVLRLSERSLIDQRFVFVGAGQAEKGIADLVVDGLLPCACYTAIGVAGAARGHPQRGRLCGPIPAGSSFPIR
jgi:malate dehydrogenase (oxaloacetate-decarboxylating)(NADP+)